MIEIGQDQHVFIAGMTGSGKSYLAENYLLYPKKHVIALDIKEDMTWSADETIESISELYQIDFPEKPIKVIYKPNIYELNDETYDEFFKFCYDLKNCTVFVDEVTAVCPSPFKIPFHYMSILSRGRSRKTNIFSLSQRPKHIPVNILSESTHYFIFRLNTLMDRKRLYEFTGEKNFLENPKEKFHFYYYNNVEEYFKEGVLI